jgi:hypothetical protein
MGYMTTAAPTVLILTPFVGALNIKVPGVAAHDIGFGAAVDNSTLGHKGHAVGSDDSDQVTCQVPYSAAIMTALLALRRVPSLFQVKLPPDAAATPITRYTWGVGTLLSAKKGDITDDGVLMIDVVIQPSAAWTDVDTTPHATVGS